MSLGHYNDKRDANEGEIVAAFREAGCTVCLISSKGIPDLLIGFKGQTYLVEVKAPEKHRAKDRGLTWHQQAWFGTWTGRPAEIVSTVERAKELVEEWS